MKALSFKQPWAWALFHGKPVDNRPWTTKYRGQIYVHASKTFDAEGWQWIYEREDRLGVRLPMPDSPAFVRGALVGLVTITDCVKYFESPWFFGPNGLVLADAVEWPEPVPWRGALGLFEVNLERG